MARRMHQRHKHLLSPLTPAGHVILHNRDAAREAVFVPKPLEDPFAVCSCFFGRDLSSPRMRSITGINRSSSASPAASCARNPAAPRTSSSCSQSADQSRTGALPPARSVPQFEPHAAPSIEIHVLHPSPSANRRQKAICCWIFTPAQPGYPVASSEGFCSGV